MTSPSPTEGEELNPTLLGNVVITEEAPQVVDHWDLVERTVGNINGDFSDASFPVHTLKLDKRERRA